MGYCFSGSPPYLLAIPSKTEEKTKEEGNSINNLHTLLEPSKYFVDRQRATTINVYL